MKKLYVAAVAAALVSTPAFAAGTSDTQAGTATATIVAPLTLTHTPGAALNFGSFSAGAGTVVVDSAGGGSVTGAVLFSPSSTTGADAFTVAGEANRNFGITTTNSQVSLGGVSMNFVTAPSAASGTLDATGAASFTVGGTLTVAGTEGAGTYTGTYNATVTYQ